MRKMYCFMWIAALGAASAFGLAGCDDANDPAPEKNPRVVLGGGIPTYNSLAFTVTPSDATECAYLCLKKEETAPAASDILGKGIFVEKLDGASEVNVPKLEAKTAYVVYAAAAWGDILSEVATLDVTTLEAPAPASVIEFKSAAKTTIEYSIDLDSEFGFYHMAMPVALYNEMMFGELGMYIDPTDPEAVLQGRIITLMAFGQYAEQSGDFSLVNGDMYFDPFMNEEYPVEVVAGVDYLLLVAGSDENLLAVEPFFEHSFRTADPAPSAATVGIEIVEGEIYFDAIGARFTPSADTKNYYLGAVATAELEAGVAEKGDEAKRDFAVALGMWAEGNKEGLIDMLEPETDYTIFALAIDADGNQAYFQQSARTTAEEQPAAVKTSVLKKLSSVAHPAKTRLR